jgi:preprotein translocase subunit SecA
MVKGLLERLLGTKHQRAVRRLQPIVDDINREWARLQALSDEELRGRTERFRAYVREKLADTERELAELRLARSQAATAAEREALSAAIAEAERLRFERTQAVLDELLVEAYATVKEACRRLVGTELVVTGQPMVWDMVPYDVQLMGAIALHQGKVAEMATGEGKTLVATMPLYLNALAGRGVHLVTVNAYLAQRDSEWMGHLYKYLGLSVGCIDLHEPGSPGRRAAYQADITYGTNNEFGFDYLRDNMVLSLQDRVQRDHFFAIIDEVDSILIDEARTPLIISGPVDSNTNDAYARYNPLVAELYRRQSRIATELLTDAERLLAEGKEYEAGEKLLLVKRGMPKHKRLLKLFADNPALQKLVLKVEGDYMRDKRLHELDEALLFAMDEKGHNVHLTDQGLDVLAPGDHSAFVVPDLSEELQRLEADPDLPPEAKRARREELEREYAEKSERMHVIQQLLKAYTLYHRDEQYVVQDGQIVIVDEFTGRMMPGRRWSDGLHQAVEAKEGVVVKGETQTLATITIQNYFRMYEKLAGMTGTAETEEAEFHEIYGLDVVVIPTNRPVIREDRHDLVYRTKREKYNAILQEVERLHRMELPVLVGTVSVEVSETLSRMLKRRGIPHEVLNAKHHAREAQIVARAGQPGAVTIATNMAGRGTDIKLGLGVTEPRTVAWLKARGIDPRSLGQPADPSRQVDFDRLRDDDVLEVGGLHIIGSERHEARRIDRQLRGRAGRQGDPGASQFFLSLEDDLMRLFGSDRIARIMDRMGVKEGEVITHPMVTRSIASAQKRVELQNFEARKRLLEYDDVMNQQREVIYDLRTFALEGGEELKSETWEMIERTVRRLLDEHAPADASPSEWSLPELRERLLYDFLVHADRLPARSEEPSPFRNREELDAYVVELVREHFEAKLRQFGPMADDLLRFVVLSTIDDRWKEHLYDLDILRASIGFRGWGQRDPLIEYKREAYDMFVDLMRDIHTTVARLVLRAQPVPVAAAASAVSPSPSMPASSVSLGPAVAAPSRASSVRTTNRESASGPAVAPAAVKVGRNDPCPCGSGKKYKKCCGRFVS